MAVVLTVLIAMAALCLDIGMLFVANQRVQDVTDASALAGAAYLTGESSCTAVDSQSGVSTPSDGAPARAAKDVAAGNNAAAQMQVRNPYYAGPGVYVSFPSGTITADDGRLIQAALGQAIKVESKIHVNYYFASIMGFSGSDIKRYSIAVLERGQSVTSARFAPWSVADTTIWNVGTTPPTPILALGASVTLVVSDWPSGFLGPGNYGPVAYDGDNGGSDYRSRIAGDAPPVTVTTSDVSGGVEVSTEPGKMIGPFKQGLDDRLNKTGEPWPSPSADSRAWNEWVASYNPTKGTATDTWRLAIVPIIRDQDYGGGRKQLEVVGFAAMFIESYTANGNDLNLTARFIRTVAVGDRLSWLPFGQTPSNTNLMSSIRLVK